MEKQPLVSVPVITYNSAKYIVEALDSVYAQTYPNIELIISDDCSNDNTIKICKAWVEEHKSRFKNVQIIEVDKNTGISANYNRAEEACVGEWVMTLDGDDKLMPNAICDFCEYVNNHPESIYVFGKVKVFGSSEKACKYYEDVVFDISFFNMTPECQYKELIYGMNHIPSAACFYNRIKKEALGINNDERIPMLEDWPKWINVIKSGTPLLFYDKYVAYYRIHPKSITGSVGKKNPLKRKTMRRFAIYYQAEEKFKRNPQMLIDEMLDYEDRLIDEYENSTSYRLGHFLLSPFMFVKSLLSKK